MLGDVRYLHPAFINPERCALKFFERNLQTKSIRASPADPGFTRWNFSFVTGCSGS